MKVKTISRSVDTYVPARNTQEQPVVRNLNPALHPFERAREYTRALTATKMERMFAQPFVCQLGKGHADGVYAIAKDSRSVSRVASGAGDGFIKYWDLTSHDEILSFRGHSNTVSGLAVNRDGNVLSCSADKTVKLWDTMNRSLISADERHGDKIQDAESVGGLKKTFYGEFGFSGIDSNYEGTNFVTGGLKLHLWDYTRNAPVSDLSWDNSDNVTSVKFNQTETSVFASSGSDRSIVIYDIRVNSPVQKMVSTLRTNALCWNPMEAFNFAAANEDHNVYLYDMRKMTRALNIYKDHVAAVMDVDFSPTGEEIATAGYDKTIRIFRTREGHSRDIYHTKRMQHVFSVKYSMDSKYILSGSDDGNVRLWRSNASERTQVKSSRERSKLEYDNALKERYKYMPEIRRIAKHRHLPAVVKKASELKKIELASAKRREENLRKHQKAPLPAPEREQHVVGVALKFPETSAKGKVTKNAKSKGKKRAE